MQLHALSPQKKKSEKRKEKQKQNKNKLAIKKIDQNHHNAFTNGSKLMSLWSNPPPSFDEVNTPTLPYTKLSGYARGCKLICLVLLL